MHPLEGKGYAPELYEIYDIPPVTPLQALLAMFWTMLLFMIVSGCIIGFKKIKSLFDEPPSKMDKKKDLRP